MERPDDYLKRAEDAEAMAARVSDPILKDQFLSLAAQWRALAESAAWARRRGLTFAAEAPH